MPYENRRFCWNGVVNPAPEAAAFYAAILGWRPGAHVVEDGSSRTLFEVDGVPLAHLEHGGQADGEGEASHWVSYLRVEDVDAATEASEKAGGRTLVPPDDISGGRFSKVASPSGVPLCLYREADEEAVRHPPPGPGAVHWTELHSADVEADVAWLETALGFEVQTMPIPGGRYYLLNSGGETRGGAVAALNDEVAGRWLAWVHVTDVDATLERIRGLGGRALTGPSDYPDVGRMAIAADPAGAVFGVMTPAG